jgi:hypothetical protein
MSKPVFASEADIDDTEPNEQKIYLNYPNGSVIIHDPKIGIEGLSILSEPEAAIPGYIMYIFLGASFIGIVSIIYKLKKKC